MNLSPNFDSYQLLVHSFSFLKILFIHERHREREAETGRERSRLHAGSPMWDSIPGRRVTTWAEGRRSTTEPLRGPWFILFHL